MKTYKLLKDLPGIPAGIEGKPDLSGNYFIGTNGYSVFYDYRFMKDHPDFFGEVKEEKMVATLGDMRKLYYSFASCPNDEGFLGMLKICFPHIKID